MMPIHDAYKKVLKAKGNSIELTMQWFNEPLFAFKHKTPNELLKAGKQKQVIDYINKHF